jgi:hypothetical protein
LPFLVLGKWFRKWGGILTGITQNIKDLPEGKEEKEAGEPAGSGCGLPGG